MRGHSCSETESVLRDDNKRAEGTNSPFPLLTNQPNIRLTLTTPLRLTRVFRSIENKDLARHRFSGNQIRILWHVSRPVDFTRMIYPLDDLDSGCRRNCVSTEFFSLVVVISSVKFVRAGRWVPAFGDLNLSNLQVILCLTGCVCSKEETVGCVGLVFVSTSLETCTGLEQNRTL